MPPQITFWILKALEENGMDPLRVYPLYKVSPAYPLIPEHSFQRKVRKIKGNSHSDYNAQARGEEAIPTKGPDLSGEDEHFKDLGTNQTIFEEHGNEASIYFKTDRITNLEELLAFAKVDLSMWRVERHTINKWEMGAVIDGKVTEVPLFQVKATLVKIIPDNPTMPVVQPLLLPRTPRLPRPERDPHKKVARHLILGDAQIGFSRNQETWELVSYHDESALAVVLQMIEDTDFDQIVILGDMLDMTEMSKYIQRPEFAQTLQPALNRLGMFLQNIRDLAPYSAITYMCGNHEERLQTQLIENFKAAYGLKAVGDSVPFYSLRKLLNLDALDIDFIEAYPAGKHWLTDDLVVVHGEYVKVNTAINATNVSQIMGHLHREEVKSKTVQERNGFTQVKTVVIGCLCKIDGTVPGVNSQPNWQQGVGIVEEYEGITNINHVTFKDGFAIFNGNYYNGN